MTTLSILEITTKISLIFCETIGSALKGVFRDRVMPQDNSHHQENIVVQEAINEKFIEIDLADNRNVLTILSGTA